MVRPVIDQKAELDYASMSIAELTAEAMELADVLDLCNSQRREIFQLIEKRKADARSKAVVAGMSELEVDALAASVQPAPMPLPMPVTTTKVA